MNNASIRLKQERDRRLSQKPKISGYLNPDKTGGFRYNGADLDAQEVAFGQAVTAYRARFKRFPANSEMLQMAREVLNRSPRRGMPT